MKSKSLFIALMMAFTMCVSAWAASVRVTGSHVRLRLNPSLNAAIYTDSYGTPIYPSKGQVLSWTGYNSNGFYEVSFHGRTLWIHSSYARPVNQATASIPENVLITGNKVLLRVARAELCATELLWRTSTPQQGRHPQMRGRERRLVACGLRQWLLLRVAQICSPILTPITTYPDTKSQGGRLLACLLRVK